MRKKTRYSGIVFLFTAAITWGFAFAAQAAGADFIGAFFFNGTRFLLGVLSLVPVILIFEKSEKNPVKMKKTVIYGAITGTILFLASYLQQVGITLTDSAGKSGFITGLYMLIVPIIGIFMKRKTEIRCWIGATLGVLGLFFICMTGGKLTFTLGDLILVAAAFVFALHIIAIDSYGQAVYSLRFTLTQFLTAAAINLICAFIFEEPSFGQIYDAAIPILYCGIMSSGVAYTCQVLGQKYSEPTSASIILSTESVFSAIGGALILNERMSPTAYFGCALIFAGILISQIKFKKTVHDAG